MERCYKQIAKESEKKRMAHPDSTGRNDDGGGGLLMFDAAPLLLLLTVNLAPSRPSSCDEEQKNILVGVRRSRKRLAGNDIFH